MKEAELDPITKFVPFDADMLGPHRAFCILFAKLKGTTVILMDQCLKQFCNNVVAIAILGCKAVDQFGRAKKAKLIELSAQGNDRGGTHAKSNTFGLTS